MVKSRGATTNKKQMKRWRMKKESCPDPVGQQPRRARQVGERHHRLPLDRRHHDSAERGGGADFSID